MPLDAPLGHDGLSGDNVCYINSVTIMADYLYDVFISYERDGLTTGWIKEHFLPLLRTWLRNTVRDVTGRPAGSIFFDKALVDPDFPDDLKLSVSGIAPGDNWEDGLRKGLRLSRCLIGIWNPPYFDSQWCNIEWQSFERRTSLTGADLIIPTFFYDGNSFPDAAKKRQAFNLHPYTLFGNALIQSKVYEKFQLTMQLLADQAAKAIRDAPAFQEWQLAEDMPPPPPPAEVALPQFAQAGQVGNG